eukprot:m.136415 g.136415  ORF g.136415 m.136415 type:complete len:92 (-) comp13138_c0_seq3:327-602(-)
MMSSLSDLDTRIAFLQQSNNTNDHDYSFNFFIAFTFISRVHRSYIQSLLDKSSLTQHFLPMYPFPRLLLHLVLDQAQTTSKGSKPRKITPT